MPKMQRLKIMQPSAMTPTAIAGNAYLNLILNIDAATAAAQALVIGIGKATNIARPIA